MSDALGWSERLPHRRMFGNRWDRPAQGSADSGQGLASTTTSSEFGEPARIKSVAPGELVGQSRQANDPMSSASGAPGPAGASEAFRTFFQPHPDDTHPTAPYQPRDADDDVARAMQRTNADIASGRGRAGSWTGGSSGSAFGAEGPGTVFAEVRGSTSGVGQAEHRSAHWRIPDGDLYKFVNNFFQQQKD